ncbi:hypothetical protein [Streptomyces olivaceoviridis]|uniref:hypothetical protein n=1 Tax=Streptomyces olivaceoviridis TaxID=1921 RepID=UPI003703410D
MTKAIRPPDELRGVGAEAFAAVAEAVKPGGPLDADRFARLLLQAGRLGRPVLLFDAWFGQVIDASTLAAHVGRVWNMAEYPVAVLARKRGARSSQQPASRPTAAPHSAPPVRSSSGAAACPSAGPTGRGPPGVSSLHLVRCSLTTPAGARTSMWSTPSH